MGNHFLYLKESLDEYFARNSTKAQPQIPKMDIKSLRKEVSEKPIFLGGAEMSRWEKEVAKKTTGFPTGRFRRDCGSFSLIEDPRGKRVHYYLDIRYPERKTKSLRRLAGRPIRDRKDAVSEAYTVMRNFYAEIDVANDPEITFSDFIPIYAADLRRRKRRKANDMVKRVKAVLEPHFGMMKLHEIRFKDIEAYRDKRQDDGVKDSTIQNEIALARALFKVAIIKEKVNVRNPFEKIGAHLGLDTELRIRWMLPEEKDLLWPELKKFPPMHELAAVLLNTGMRPHNLISLKWRQIRKGEKEPYIYVPKSEFKTNKEAYFPLNPTAQKILQRLKEQNPNKPDDLVFVRRDGAGQTQSITRQWYQAHWRKACAEAGIENLRFYDLKHTLGQFMREQGESDFTIRDTFNHTNLKSTERYIGFNVAPVSRALKRVDPVLNGLGVE